MKLRERTTATLLIAIFMISIFAVAIPAMAKKGGTTIQDGTLLDSEGNPLVLGFDEYGYNYQAHMFSGLYDDYDRVHGGAFPDVYLTMKWSDVCISNMDRDGDGLLDRGYSPGNEPPYTSSAAEGAWLTNHQWGINEDGTHWYYFVKIVHPGDDAVLVAGAWYTADDVEIGPVIWGAYARILQISNDPAYDEHGVLNNWPAPTGFGYYK